MIALYPVRGGRKLELKPGEVKRERFVDHAYKCAPLTVANRYGWDLFSSEKLVVEWSGGPDKDAVVCHSGPGYAHFGQGTFTLAVGYVWRLPESWDLLVMPVPNSDRMDFLAMTALMEADWLPYPWFLSISITRPGMIEIPAKTPLARVMPVQRMEDEAIRFDEMPAEIAELQDQWASKRGAVGDHSLYRRNLKRGSGQCAKP